MCVGVPMKVLQDNGGSALCRDGDVVTEIDTALVGPVEPGQWLMVFLGAAREKISEDYAMQCRDALEALNRVMNGDGNIDHLFADLIGREPELPDFLKPQAEAHKQSGQPAKSVGED